MRALFLSLFLIAAFSCKAQKIEKYFDFLWKECEPNSARFYALIEKTDSGWHRRDYFIQERKLQMDGTFEDADCKFENGWFYYLHANGIIQSTGNYVHGKREGLWLRYHPNGMMSDSTFYRNGNPFGNSLSWHENGYPHDSASWNADGSGTVISWFDNGLLSSAGRYAAGKKETGKWQFFHTNGNLSATETFNDGILENKEYFDEQGNKINDTTDKSRTAEFSGGKNAWLKYVFKGLYFPAEYKIVNADRAVVIVAFTIDENGNVTNVFASTPFHPAFDKIAVARIKKSPQWIPAMQHNRKVKTKMLQPVSFKQE